MKAVGSNKFEILMAKKIDKMWKNKIDEIIMKSEMWKGHTFLRSVWTHRRKTTYDGNIYRHRSSLCDISTHTYDRDYNDTYNPVVM